MKIGIFTGDHTKNETGIGNYILNLVNQFKLFPDELSIIRHPKGYDYSIKNQIIPYTISSAGMMVWSCAVAAQKHLIADLDIVHSPTLALFPIKPHDNYVLTVHDIIFKKFPQFLPKGTVRHTNLFFNRNLTLADKIIADSESTKNDLVLEYKVPIDKITVIPVAADQIYHKLPEREILKIKEKYALFNPFILYVGTIEPRKNITLILKAFAHCQKFLPEYNLVIAGKKGWYYNEIYHTLSQLHIHEKVIFLGYIPLEDLPGLYNAADLFVYPSLYEGFGLPPLEAMQCGTPVITSNVSSLPEVVGKDGMMIDPLDKNGLSQMLIKILTDDEYYQYQKEYGKERSKLFSWKKTAEKTYATYKDVIEKSRP